MDSAAQALGWVLLAIVVAMSLTVGIAIGLYARPDTPLPEVTDSQLRTELAVCIAAVDRSMEALDSVQVWLDVATTQPIAWNIARRGLR